MKNKELKKIQRQVNKQIKRINDNILNDYLWNGRFVVKQINRFDSRYEDGSGYYIGFIFNLIDLKTNIQKEYIERHVNDASIFFPAHLFEALNNFIIEDCKVWEDKENPRDNKTIYRTK